MSHAGKLMYATYYIDQVQVGRSTLPHLSRKFAHDNTHLSRKFAHDNTRYILEEYGRNYSVEYIGSTNEL